MTAIKADPATSAARAAEPQLWRNPRKVLPALWAFLLFNFIYCDILGLYWAPDLKQLLDGSIGGITLSEGFLLGAGVLMEISMVMFLLSSIALRRVVRIASVVAAPLLIVVQSGSLFAGDGNTMHYLFYSAVEIATLAVIGVVGWRFRAEK